MMSFALITGDWFHLGRDLYFRKFDLYCMLWSNDICFEDLVISCGQYGGPIALRRNESKFIKVNSSAPTSMVSIFSASGQQITSLKWSNKKIICMGWTNDENLICVQEDAMVVLHDMFGKYLHAFNIQRDSKVVDARIFTSSQNCIGVAVLTAKYQFFLVNNVYEPKTRQLPDSVGSNIEPSSWSVIPESSHTDILFASGCDLCRLKQDEYPLVMMQPDIKTNYEKILKIAVSFNTRHLALFLDSGHLWMGSLDLRVKYCEIDTNCTTSPKQLMWCGNEAVVITREQSNTLVIVSKNGETTSYTYNSAMHLVEEIDGVRIVTQSTHELLQKVPDVVQKLFRINSTDPGSFLLEASKHFQRNSHKANEYIVLVNKHLNEAVKQCLEAARYEFDVELQKLLIRAAQFGKCFISDVQPDSYVNTLLLLRVLNAVRNPKIGIPLTYTQFSCLHEKALISRLIVRREYYLALLIANYLKIPKKDGNDFVLLHWAKNKVSQSHLDEEAVARCIVEKLKHSDGISYTEIACAAAECGKKKLAIKLLDYESKFCDQVKLLLQLDQTTPALVKAIESGDTEMIYMVILKLRDILSLAEFKMTIRNFPVAQSLYIKYCQEHKPDLLKEIYVQEDDFSAQAETCIQEMLRKQSDSSVDVLLNSALEAYKKGRKDFCVSVCEDMIKLSKFQQELDRKFKGDYQFTGMSAHDTCKLLLETNEIRLAEKLKSLVKIPEKRYFWLKIQALVYLRNWDELEKVTKVQKLPINVTSIIDICLASGHSEVASKYMPRVPDEFKVKYFLKLSNFEDAANIAFSQKDIQSLLFVQSKCAQDKRLYEKINGLLQQLKP